MIIASKKRKILAIYIDLLLFLTFKELFEYFFESVLPFLAWIIAFGLILYMSNKFLPSPGKHFLSIEKDNTVEPIIYENESWLTLLLGVLLILEGTKNLVRWTEFMVPMPFFGIFIDSAAQIIFSVIAGILFLLSGYLILKLKMPGLLLGIGITIVTIVSSLLSWDLWDPFITQMVEARRNFQDIPVRESEVEFMNMIYPKMIIVIEFIYLIAMILSMQRFKLASRPATEDDR
ncbi:hypothetical protein [Methylomonas sp. HYX-M1]|uniref:hypothetical protein n=1 Tax=Methylomonas sp. HYX-M1 TaxID=3139307 RepID=UPI00345C3F8C